jgi:molybdate/tungstate transport system permease protein
VISSIILTLVSSATASLILVVILTPAAYYLARNRNPILETLADIPASIPHPVIGICLLLLNSRITPFGNFLHSLGIDFFNTFLGLVTALTIISAPIYLKSLQPFYISMPKEPEIYAMGIGASELMTFLSVVLPNSPRGITSAYLISMSRSMSEFGSIAIIAYAVLQFPFYGTSPAPVLIYQYYSFYGLGPALTSSALMVVVAIIFMVILRMVERHNK